MRTGKALLSACALGAVLATSAGAQKLNLIPYPREVRPVASMPLLNGVHVLCSAPCSPDDQFATDDLAADLQARGIRNAAGPAGVTIELTRLGTRPLPSGLTFDDAMKPEGYIISASANTLSVIGASAEGVFYGAQTVKQMVAISRNLDGGAVAVLHAADIRDWPAIKYRGLDDDLSRGPVTTLDFQKKLIRTLAAYKLNLYSPYSETAMQYRSNPLSGPPGGSMSAADARALVAYARPYHVMIVPEQEAFGHLHHLLTWDQYQPLAETPHGAVLAPGQPGSIELIKQWFTELADLYPAPFLHIGADETVDLGLGQTKPDVDARTLGPVYLDFLDRIVTALAPLHRKLLFWGDIAMDSPDLVAKMPPSFKQATIAIAWTYNPDPRGFDRYLTPFTRAGIETWVAPGVNNWSRVYPNNNLALANIQQFVRDGQRLGSTGALNTIWNDDGEGLINSDWYGILFGAAAAWQKGESSIPQFQSSYAQVFHGDATGALNQAQIEMMAAHSLLHDQAKTGDGSDGLFWLDPWSKDGLTYADKIRPYTRELRLHAERALTLIAQARAAAPAASPSFTVAGAGPPPTTLPLLTPRLPRPWPRPTPSMPSSSAPVAWTSSASSSSSPKRWRGATNAPTPCRPLPIASSGWPSPASYPTSTALMAASATSAMPTRSFAISTSRPGCAAIARMLSVPCSSTTTTPSASGTPAPIRSVPRSGSGTRTIPCRWPLTSASRLRRPEASDARHDDHSPVATFRRRAAGAPGDRA